MSGIYIPGMEMPKNCMECPIAVCLKTKDDCPLVPVPPHGRLIDADELDSYLKTAAIMADGEAKEAYIDARAEARTMYVIIPAEEEREA